MVKQQRIDKYIEYMSIVKRDGKDRLAEWLINKTDFFTAPASSKYHNNYEGGLFDHSENVLKAAKLLYIFSKEHNKNVPEISMESITICALHHDLCKINFYTKENAWTKNNNKWLEYETYKVTNNDFPFGHGDKSVVLMLKQGFEISNNEMLAIKWHMGPYGETGMDYNLAMENYLVKLIHIADVSSSMLIEKTIDYKQIAINK